MRLSLTSVTSKLTSGGFGGKIGINGSPSNEIVMKHLAFEGPDSGTKRLHVASCPLCPRSHELYKTGGFVTKRRSVWAKPGVGLGLIGARGIWRLTFVGVRDTSSSSCTKGYPQRVQFKVSDPVF